jgi:transcriptional regulator with XRE-family HTH domain
MTKVPVREYEDWPMWMITANPRAAREVRRRRVAMELTQAELGALLGINRMSVSRWERGVHPVRVSFWIAIDRIEQDRRKKLRERDRAEEERLER